MGQSLGEPTNLSEESIVELYIELQVSTSTTLKYTDFYLEIIATYVNIILYMES